MCVCVCVWERDLDILPTPHVAVEKDSDKPCVWAHAAGIALQIGNGSVLGDSGCEPSMTVNKYNLDRHKATKIYAGPEASARGCLLKKSLAKTHVLPSCCSSFSPKGLGSRASSAWAS